MTSKALRKIQLGRETTAGTPVAATTIWRGLGMFKDDRKVVFPEEDVGILPGTDRSYVPTLGASLPMDAVEATFEQLCHIFEAGIKLVGTGVSDGAGTDKIYAYPFPTTAVNAIKTYTIEGGVADADMQEMEYAFVSEFSLSGAQGEALKVDATWLGRQLTSANFTGALTVPTVEEILIGKAKLYVDLIGGTIGTTLISDTLLDLNLKCTTGWQVHGDTGDGNKYFLGIDFSMPEITLEMTWKFNATAIAQRTAWQNQTARLIQVKFEGSAVATPGTLYSYKTLLLNLAGKWEAVDSIGDEDGLNILPLTFRSKYDPTAAQFATFTVVNELAAVP